MKKKKKDYGILANAAESRKLNISIIISWGRSSKEELERGDSTLLLIALCASISFVTKNNIGLFLVSEINKKLELTYKLYR